MRQVQARRVVAPIPFAETVIVDHRAQPRSDDDFEPSRADSELDCAQWLSREVLAELAAGRDPLDDNEGGDCDVAPWRFSFVDGAVLLVVLLSALWGARLLARLWLELTR
jgi:hypothetical protein